MSADTLNPAQQQAVRVGGHCVITAPPGSGKTKVLEHRAEFLLNSDPSHAVLGVTFTSDAAAELEARIRVLVPNAGKRLVCGTFHSLCKRQLEAAGERFMLVNEIQQFDLIHRAYAEIIAGLTEEESAISFEDALAHINRIKSAVDPMIGRSPRELTLTELADRYRDMLTQMGALDFADLLIDTVRGMKSGKIKPWKVSHMLVDECQDSDDVQYAWVREHARRGVVVSVVGDDDQSIYGWREAKGFRGMEDFRREHAAAHITLNITYRCAREIISPAAQLIAHNIERVPKTIQTANRGAGSVAVKPCASSKDEHLEAIAAIRQSGEPGDWGVLARSNEALDALERALMPANVPYVRSGGVSFWDIKGPALFLSVCASLAGNNLIGVDDLMRKCGIGEDQLRRIHAGCNSHKEGALKRFIHGPAREGLAGEMQGLLRQWDALLHAGGTGPVVMLHALADFIKSRATLYDKGRTSEKKKDHEKLDECAHALSTLKGALGARLHLLKTNEKKPRDDGQNVRIMTLHASKGLEFRNVWILGCGEGVLPSSRSDDLDEERRLFYVGMTRAKERLVLSYSLAEKGQRSTFLTEAGL